MDASDLRVFEAVARLGAMSRAAVELNTVQSNVTSRIKALEAELAVDLFRRTGRGVELTEAGHRLLPYTHRMKDLLGDARRAVVDDGHPSGLLRIGTLETTAALRLSPCIPAFAAAARNSPKRWPNPILPEYISTSSSGRQRRATRSSRARRSRSSGS